MLLILILCLIIIHVRKGIEFITVKRPLLNDPILRCKRNGIRPIVSIALWFMAWSPQG